ncbi:meiotic recombination protein W68 [Stomoxys calcitrans]|uniref:meiotic recombination protein W68 n=1 Tax=Stomoxys calcitrans TaxID=35570 RepID=UPI0027E302F9|nr:meiotic recombination protein W68 [Stomoxys calcitrans]
MINSIESLINSLLRDLLLRGPNTEIRIKNSSRNNMVTVGEQQDENDHSDDNGGGNPTYRCSHNLQSDVSPNDNDEVVETLIYGRRTHRQRIAMILFTLAQTHDLLLNRRCCTYRELLYKNNHMASNMLHINRAVQDVCCLLNQTSWNLGIFSSGKGLIAGPLLIVMSNGDTIDCNCLTTPTMIPPNFTYIDHFQTQAQIIVVVEKDTIFKKLLQSPLFSVMKGKVLLITARGNPDLSTRWLLNKLSRAHTHLAMYMLADGDPYGIEIMLTYRYGSQKYKHQAMELACPHIKWLGIHPSDISHNMLHVPQQPLSAKDYAKIESILKRCYVKEEIRRELIVLKHHGYKAKLDNMSGQTFSFFVYDYIVNKIKRQVVL